MKKKEDKTKVAIITITDGQNYGNRLQNYALQEVLKELGCDVYTIRRKSSRDRSVIDTSLFVLRQIVRKCCGKKNTEFCRIIRSIRFGRFNRLITFSKECIGFNEAPSNLKDKYDYFVCGSDQIWNTRFQIIREDINNYLACFATPEKRISYAASFGVDNIELEYEELFRDELSQFKSLSVRETPGVKIIKTLTGREDVRTVLDPTLLVRTNVWNKIAKQPRYIKKKRYILTYFLSESNEKLEEYKKKIEDLWQCERLELNIEFMRDNQITDKDKFSTSPEEFLWLVSRAECVLTDSYHACIFSLLYGKPFTAFQRKSTENENDTSSRVVSLLKIFGLQEFIDNIDNPSVIPKAYDISAIDKLLNEFRAESREFLILSLERNQ